MILEIVLLLCVYLLSYRTQLKNVESLFKLIFGQDFFFIFIR